MVELRKPSVADIREELIKILHPEHEVMLKLRTEHLKALVLIKDHYDHKTLGATVRFLIEDFSGIKRQLGD